MAHASPPRAESVRRAGGPEVHPVQDGLPFPTGIFQVAEKMEKRTCALCPKDLEYSVLYFAQSENIAAHECCLLYSSALVECEDHDPHNFDRNFDVESVKKEIQRGRKLKCTLCRERGATVGCDLKTCAKNYHFFCARKDNAFPQADGARGIYKVLCQQHAPRSPTNAQSADGVKRKRGRKKRLPTGIHVPQPETTTFNRFIKSMKEKNSGSPDAIVKTPFLKKCKEAGLLNDLFEEILDKLHLIQERLMDETTSESEYEEIGTSLFDCRLFEDTFVNFQAAIENKIHESEEMRQQLKEDIELLQDLKQTLCSFQENRDLRSSSTSESSLSS
ncbi:PHD finger protein 11 isoform X2 [Ictidomys tridecemlineatus]|uniref:PHD finger protein 11 isoform X3 n=1 Tax=Ictidomys tridecemlineatus TaxID=43179 RepID=UPI00038BE41D|nr:PHD finger protein 11 isoform X3 [Ictidomys tridecemlineatus]KAG3293094.1 histone-lysine N-methyltransferase SETDB2, transcript variant X3 [Ictidomys tridecemlineatus]